MEQELAETVTLARNAGDFRAAEHKLEADLLLERTKVRVLIDELEVPLNMHRWRKLESSDPERLDLLKQVQSLQQRLIAKADAIEQKDKLIKQKEELYVELKNVMARQPGPETAEQLTVFQDNLKQKCKQLKAMEDELQMYRQQVEVFKLDIDAANADMRAVNTEWLQHMEQQWQAAANAQYYHNVQQQQQQQQQQQYYSSNSSGTADHGVANGGSSSAVATNAASSGSFMKSITAPAT
jgi:hypothetical protein